MKRNRLTITGVCVGIIIVLIVAMVGIIIAESGLFSSEPVVSTKADNCYEETLYVITDEDYMPYSFYDSDGNISGHDVELINIIANKLHMNLDLKMMQWDEAIEAIGKGEAQVLMTCDYSDTFIGVDRLLKTEPVSTDEFIVYSKSAIPAVDELYEKTCAIMQDGNVLAQIKMLNLNKNSFRYANNREVMKALERDEVDCAIMRYTVGEALLKELGYNDIKGTISIGRSYMCFGLADGNDFLANRINGVIEELKLSGEMERLQDKWLTGFIHTYTLPELLKNNIRAVIAIICLFLLALLIILNNERKKNQIQRENFRYIEIVENLSNDFDCVNYIELKDEVGDDEAVLVRISDTLRKSIPKWSTETNFRKRLEILMTEAVVPEDREAFYTMTRRDEILRNLKNGAYFVNFRAELDGETKYCQLKFSTIENEEGKITAFVCGLHDIDEETRKEIAAQEALQAALDKEKVTEQELAGELERGRHLQKSLEEASRSKTDFLFNMSHDIRTPMNAITGFTDMAEKHIDEKEKVEDYLHKIKNASNHLLELINEVLDMSRVEAGKLNSEMKTVNIRKEAEKMITICRETADARNIRMTLIMDDIENENVICDQLHINRIITNIIGNAIKYTMPGGNVVYSITELSSDNPAYGRYEFIIEDNGIGMSKDFLGKIFESFSREETEVVNGIQGTGLGMAIVKRLVDYLDGTIEIESEQGRGTKVTLVFHFRLAEGDAPDYDMGQSDIRLNGKKALLVEDNDLNREIAMEILTDHGVEADEAVNGKEAVSMVKNKGVGYYDFILMDIQMPFMNGYEATKAIRALPGSEKLIIIALSANAFEEDRQKSIESGMNEHIAKPINVGEMLGVISKHM